MASTHCPAVFFAGGPSKEVESEEGRGGVHRACRRESKERLSVEEEVGGCSSVRAMAHRGLLAVEERTGWSCSARSGRNKVDVGERQRRNWANGWTGPAAAKGKTVVCSERSKIRGDDCCQTSDGGSWDWGVPWD